MDIAELLAFSVKNNSSDLHISAGLPPMIRVDGDLRKINLPDLDHKDVIKIVYDILNDRQRKEFELMSRTFHHGERRIVVRGVLREQPDTHRIARAIVELAEMKAEAEAEADHRRQDSLLSSRRRQSPRDTRPKPETRGDA